MDIASYCMNGNSNLRHCCKSTSCSQLYIAIQYSMKSTLPHLKCNVICNTILLYAPMRCTIYTCIHSTLSMHIASYLQLKLASQVEVLFICSCVEVPLLYVCIQACMLVCSYILNNACMQSYGHNAEGVFAIDGVSMVESLRSKLLYSNLKQYYKSHQ